MIGTPATRVENANPAEPEDESDGRRQRAVRNREAVVTALLEIIREQDGGPIPGAAEVAERAGVSERTVFRHFADLESLFLAGAEHQRPLLRSYLTPRPDDKELDKRIAALVRLRAKMYEEIGPIRRVAMRAASRADSTSISELVEEANKASRRQVAEVFAPELSRAGRERSLLLDQLDLATSWPVWDSLRRHLDHSAERSRRIMSALVSSVLAPYAGRRRVH